MNTFVELERDAHAAAVSGDVQGLATAIRAMKAFVEGEEAEIVEMERILEEVCDGAATAGVAATDQRQHN